MKTLRGKKMDIGQTIVSALTIFISKLYKIIGYITRERFSDYRQ